MHLTVDGFVLRFPRTGIVNYTFHTLEEYLRRPGIDLTVLLEDTNFSDPEISRFMANGIDTRLVETCIEPTAAGRKREEEHSRNLSIRLPTPREVSRCVAPGEIYHATDWYHYPSRHAKANILTYFDLTTKLHSHFHEYTNIEKERRKENAIKDFDHIVAISESTRNDLIEYCGASPDSITTSYLGTHPTYERPHYSSRHELLKKYKLDPGTRYILSVSTIEPRKNIIGILEAFKSLCSQYSNYKDIKLLLSGHMGWKNESLNEYITSYPFKDNIIFVGYVAIEDMPSLYHNAEAFIYLSFYEGFGLPILEAMKSRCPVVCSNVSSMPEVIGDCGEQVSPTTPDEAAAALARILDKPDYAAKLRFAGYARAREFSWRRHVDDLMDIYARV